MIDSYKNGIARSRAWGHGILSLTCSSRPEGVRRAGLMAAASITGLARNPGRESSTGSPRITNCDEKPRGVQATLTP